jgi:PqqD family protein of HPr-rel-A system
MTVAATRPRVRGDLTVVVLDGEAVVYDEASGELHHLNPSATVVFELLDGTSTIRELATDVADAFGRPPEEIEKQIRTLVRRFRRLGLLNGDVRPARA